MRSLAQRVLQSRLRASRQRAQSFVEFGMGVAAVAFVAVIGFNALGTAQAMYWGAPGQPSGLSQTLAPPTPAPGVFIHPTSVDAPTCNQNLSSPILVGATITCTTTVHDVFQNPNDRNPPLGTLDWVLDGTPYPNMACSSQPGASPPLMNAPTTSSNSCTVAFTWNTSCPVGSCTGVIGTHTLLAKYGPSSNHAPSSVSTSFTITPNLHWASSCTNDLLTPIQIATSVAVGHPLRCGVTLTDGSNGSTYQPVVGQPISWSLSALTGGGMPNFTCLPTSVAGGVLMSGATPCGNANTSYACVTDTTGSCQVIYRHLYDTNGFGIGANPTLQMQAASYYTAPYNLSTFNLTISAPSAQQPTGIVVLCDGSPDPQHLTVVQRPIGDPDTVFGLAKFGGTTVAPSGTWGGTNDLDVNNAPQYKTTVTCTAFVYDTVNNGANNPAVSASANPNIEAAFPPVGTVTFNWYPDGVTPSLPTGGACALLPTSSSAHPVQSGTQAPFMSACTTTFQITGMPSPPSQPFINAQYGGESTPSPAHKPAMSPQPGSLPGYRFNVDFS